MNYLLGGSGVIGTAISRQISQQNLVVIPRSEYITWGEEKRFAEYFLTKELNENDTFYYCSGITNPKANAEEIALLNFQLPLAILGRSIETGHNVVTFGTILENSKVQNRYIDSKRKFLERASQFTNLQTHRHYQLHTVYGFHAPKAHMLLGKIHFAIQNESILEMTSGMQLREYWHASDIVSFIASTEIGFNRENVIQVSSGYPMKLSEIAMAIFKYFSAEHLLHIGSLPDEPNELYNLEMFKQTENAAQYMRDPIKGIIAYLESYLREIK